MARMDSIVAANIRGSVGGLTFTRSRTHAIVLRARTAPVNFETNNRTNIRSSMAYAAALWTGLSDADKVGWATYAQSLTYTDPVDGGYSPTGRQAFVACIQRARYANNRGISDVVIGTDFPVIPGFFNVDTPTVGAPSAAGTGLGITLNNSTSEDAVFMVQISRAFLPARNQWKGPWNPLFYVGEAVPTSTGTTLDVTSLTEGYAYFLKIAAITDAEPLRISTTWYLRGIAETTV